MAPFLITEYLRRNAVRHPAVHDDHSSGLQVAAMRKCATTSRNAPEPGRSRDHVAFSTHAMLFRVSRGKNILPLQTAGIKVKTRKTSTRSAGASSAGKESRFMFGQKFKSTRTCMHPLSISTNVRIRQKQYVYLDYEFAENNEQTALSEVPR